MCRNGVLRAGRPLCSPAFDVLFVRTAAGRSLVGTRRRFLFAHTSFGQRSSLSTVPYICDHFPTAWNPRFRSRGRHILPFPFVACRARIKYWSAILRQSSRASSSNRNKSPSLKRSHSATNSALSHGSAFDCGIETAADEMRFPCMGTKRVGHGSVPAARLGMCAAHRTAAMGEGKRALTC